MDIRCHHGNVIHCSCWIRSGSTSLFRLDSYWICCSFWIVYCWDNAWFGSRL